MDSAGNLDEVIGDITEYWKPVTVASINDYDARVAKVKDEFVWHEHGATDEFFLVLSGELTIEMEDRDPVVLGRNDVFVIPRGVRHKPHADTETVIMLFEPSSVVNTGDNPRTGTARTLHQ